MLRFYGLLNVLLLLVSAPAHPMMGDVDTTISPLSIDMSTAPSVQENSTPADEHIASTARPSAEELDITMTHAPTTQLGSVTDMNTFAPTELSTTLSNLSPSIIGMTNLFETPTTTHLTPASELSTMVPTTQSTPAPELSTMVPTTHSTPAPELSTMVPSVETNSVVPPDTPSETITTTNSPMTLPAATLMTMTTSNHDTTEILNPPGDTVSVALPTTTLSPLLSLFGFTSPNDLAGFNDLNVPNKIDEPVDNVLTMSSNEETTRMATSTDTKIDGGDKQTAPLAGVTEPPKAQETSNNVDSNGNSGCDSISTSLALLSLAALYVVV